MSRAARRAVAFHEAGHALAHARLKFPFWSVSIVPRDGMKGYVHMPDFADYYAQDVPRLIDAAVTVLAGPLAERRAIGHVTEADSLRDYGSVSALLAHRLGGYVSLRQIEAATDALLEDSWPDVERIAGALLDRKRLSAGDVFALLAGEAGRRRNA